MSNTNTDFIMPVDGYLTFDALSLKQFIKDRLNETGVFTDQNFEGSYVSTVVEIIAITFNQLLYYLNRTSNESMFSEAQLYENMNRIVKILSYSPVGKQTATLPFIMSANENLDPQIYTIPRYTYIENGTKSYSINEDIVFSKTLTTSQEFSDISSQKLLYQGKYVEHSKYNAVGNDYEIVYLDAGINTLIDHFNIDVYVKKNTVWSKWDKVSSLYLENAFSKSYELRLNDSKLYEIKFGNNINGMKLEEGDVVQIYYLESSGVDGEIGVGEIDGKQINIFNSSTFREILTSINTQNINAYTYITQQEMANISFTNESMSTNYQEEETVESIRQNAPGIFRAQHRLVTEYDYKNYIKTNFANLIQDVQVCNNWKYMTEVMKYYYDIGITNPNNISNAMFNQVNFANSCNFNNIYIVTVPRVSVDTKNPTSVLSPSQSELITSSLKSTKTMTSEIIIIDPIYIAASICGGGIGETPSISNISNSKLQIVKSINSRRSDESIKLDIENIFKDYFKRSNMKLGDYLDINYLTNQIFAVDGLENFYTVRTDLNTKYNGLSMLMWNPIYQTDMAVVYKDVSNPFFKFLYLYDSDNFKNLLEVVSDVTIYETIEY